MNFENVNLEWRRWRGERALGKFLDIYPEDEIPTDLLLALKQFFIDRRRKLER